MTNCKENALSAKHEQSTLVRYQNGRIVVRPFFVALIFRILVAVSEAKEDGGASEVVCLAEAAFKVALVAPMEQTEVAAINDEPWRTGVGLDHIAKLGVSVFEAGWRMSGYGIHK